MERPIALKSAVAPIRHGASIAVLKGGAALLVKRRRGGFAGLWSLPGGHIEPQETPRQAALRELGEETGLIAEIAGLLDTIEVEARDDGGNLLRYRLSVFYGTPIGGDLRAGSDAAAAEWVGLGDIGALALTEGAAALIGRAARRLGLA